MNTFNKATLRIDTMIKPVFTNPYVMAVLKIAIVLYAAQIAPKLPATVTNYFENTYFKILFIATIVYVSVHDLQLAIMLAVVFVISINLLSGRKFMESFSNFSQNFTPEGDQKLIEPNTVIYPGCLKVTLQDIYTAFDNDQVKLQNTVQYAYKLLLDNSKNKDAKALAIQIAYATGLPYNIDVTREENAPYIATLLMYFGFKITDTCTAPNK